MKRKLFIACAALASALALATACKDDGIDHSGEVHATTDEVMCNQYHTAVSIANTYGNGITDRGVCWGTGEFPTLEDYSVSDGIGGTGTYTLDITGLSAGKLYYTRAYATASSGRTFYGSSRSFTTVAFLSTKILSTTPDLTAIKVKASISDGLEGLTISERGVYYGTSANPETTGTKLAAANGGKGEFEVTITDLEMATEYYIKSYAVSEEGTIYSDVAEVSTATPTPELFLNALNSAGLRYGIVRDANMEFVMHYTYDINPSVADDCFITITCIESTGDRDAIHVTEQVTFNADYSQAAWNTVSNDGNDLSGMTRVGTDFSLTGTDGLTLDIPMPSEDIYGMYTNSSYGGINRVSELRSGNHHGSVPVSLFSNVYCVEYNGESGGIVTYPWTNPGWVYFLNKFENNVPYIPITEDRAVFTFGSYSGSDSSETRQTAWEVLEPVTNIWYDPDGVLIVREAKETATITEGAFYVYAISAKNKGWIKWFLRKYGD